MTGGAPVGEVEVLGEILFVEERIVVSLTAGRFEDPGLELPMHVEVGTGLGTVADVPVRSTFSGELLEMLALPGERLRAGQPIAWGRLVPHDVNEPGGFPMTEDKAFEMFRDCTVDVLQVDPELVRFEARFGDDLEADSLDLLELALAVEEAFGIRLVEEELREVETVEQAFALVCGKL